MGKRVSQSLAVMFLMANSLRADIVAESRIHGERFLVRVTERAIKDSPTWPRDADNPPLSARRAIEAATGMQKQLVKDTDSYKWILESATLKRYEGELWYWDVSFLAEPVGIHTGRPPSLRLIVLMDGTTVRPSVTRIKD